MISQADLKTLVPSVVMSGVLLYEAISGNAVSEHVQSNLTNGILIGAGYMVTLWGIWKNHQKSVQKSSPSLAPQLTPADTEPPKIPPDQTGVQNKTSTSIVTQEDLNNRLGS